MTSIDNSVSEETKKIHTQVIYPMARVLGEKHGGSGTVIYSEKDTESKYKDYESFILTNNHVIEELVEVKTEFDSSIGRDVKKQITKQATVELFRYKYWSVSDREYGVKAHIVAWDSRMDLALLKLDSIDKIDYVAKLHPHEFVDIEKEQMPNIHMGDKLMTVGAALLNPPVITEGRISYMFQEFRNNSYFLTTAPSIYGSSGGATYTTNDDGDWELIGVPALISIASSGFFSQAVPHLSWSIPIFTVYEFLRKNYFEYVYNGGVTKKECLLQKEKEKKQANIEEILRATKEEMA